ncbi:MAG: DUF4876 domain-containing protein [Proteiniphilum sp.]|uniref:DUF4876 domain-containing protein n=1 Tax=Proteiniphilum sp. TaxID=1926877 RepID=UPI002B1F4B3F|nr:DUF4876 domain-containing protein [Proteiniphilum sp.]MEA5129259.1 DUF4876 domain-containing protein [Proteiniphilum sp.]
MKRTLFNFLFIAAISLLIFSSCSDDDEKVAVRYTIDVTVQYPDGYTEGSASDIEVKATNTQTGTSVSAKTNANGVAQFSLASGVYSFTVAQETEDFVFNGLLENTTIAEDKSLSITLHASAVSGGLVLKEIYYSGSRVPGSSSSSSYFHDSFTEIYNNSDEVIYLDNIGFGALDPATSNTPSPWMDGNSYPQDRLPLFGYTFYFKGSGTDYPLQPRTSIVIAMDGIDHKDDPAGNPDSPVNLGNADWELYVGDINGGKDADAPGVPNMEVLHTTSTSLVDALYSVFGPAMVIFSFPEGTDPAAFATDAANLSTKPGGNTTEYLMIPKDHIIDIVECVNHDGRHNKRVPADLDAGLTFIEAGTYSGKSVRRKVSQIIDGKVVYKDTNNSTEDFLQDQTPTPFVHPTTVD